MLWKRMKAFGQVDHETTSCLVEGGGVGKHFGGLRQHIDKEAMGPIEIFVDKTISLTPPSPPSQREVS
jgi:hypothetical protein